MSNLPSLNYLHSYAYFNENIANIIDSTNKDPRINLRLLIDSGAFTAYTTGKIITLDQYLRFIDDLPLKPWGYFALDVIGNPKKTMDNYKAMLSHGYNPIPIYTVGQQQEDIGFYRDNSDRIAIGGLVGPPKKTILRELVKFHKAASGANYHVLGNTSLPTLKHFKPFSCDSSTWASGARFGSFNLYLGGGKIKLINRKIFASKPDDKIIQRLKWLGFTTKEMTSAEHWKGGASFVRRGGASSWVSLSIDVEKQLKTKLFLAGCTDLCLKLLKHAYLHQTQQKRAA